MVKDRLANLGHAQPADLGAELEGADLYAAGAGEAPVPGGVTAFAAIARMPATPSANGPSSWATA